MQGWGLGRNGGSGGGVLDFMGGWVVIAKAVGLSVVLIEPTDTVHLIVDAAGDVFNVLHVGSAEHEPIIELERKYNRYANIPYIFCPNQ